MFLLRVNVADEGVEIGRPHGECTVSALPCELCQFRRLRLEPLRRARLQILDQLCDGDGPREADGQVDVVRNAANPKAFAVDAAYYGCQIGVELFAYRRSEHRCAVFGAENEMNEQE